MTKLADTPLVWFGAFGTAWTLLREFGVEVEATLIALAFLAGMLVALRIRAIVIRRSAPNDRRR